MSMVRTNSQEHPLRVMTLDFLLAFAVCAGTVVAVAVALPLIFPVAPVSFPDDIVAYSKTGIVLFVAFSFALLHDARFKNGYVHLGRWSGGLVLGHGEWMAGYAGIALVSGLVSSSFSVVHAYYAATLACPVMGNC